MNKVVTSLVAITVLVGSIVTPNSYAFASESKESAPEINLELSSSEVKEEKEFFENLADELSDVSTEEYVEVFDTYIEENETDIVELLIEEGYTGTESILINDKDVDWTYNIDDTSSIEVTSEGIVLDIVEIGEEREATDEESEQLDSEVAVGENESTIASLLKTVLFIKPAEAASKKTKNASNTKVVYSWIKTKVFTAHIAADFTYDGKKVTASRTSNYIKRNWDGTLYQVYDKESKVRKPSDKKRTAYQQAMVNFGLNYKGAGLVFFETFIQVNVSSDHKGNITKSSKVE